MGNERKTQNQRETGKVKCQSYPNKKKEHTIMRKKSLHEKPNVPPLEFFPLLTESYFQSLAPRKNFFQLCGCLYYLEYL